MVSRLIQRGQHIDLMMFEGIFRRRGGDTVDALFYGLSRSADGYLYPLPFLALLVLDAPGAANLLYAGAVAFAINLSVYKVVKSAFRRVRPFERLPDVACGIKPPDAYSFPSGHTAGAFVMATLWSSYFPSAAPLLYTWAAGVGYSRVYNGVHYPADVLAGVALGWGCAIAGGVLVS
jgi:undecaprenyl-diphosphatase